MMQTPKDARLKLATRVLVISLTARISASLKGQKEDGIKVKEQQ